MNLLRVAVVAVAGYLAVGFVNPSLLHSQSDSNAQLRKETASKTGEKKASPANDVKPQLGTLAATGSSGFGSRKTDMPWSPDSDKGEGTPISGSVSRNGRNWIAKVFNNTDFAYSVSLQVYQYDNRRNQVKSDSFSATVKSKSSIEKEFTSALNSAQAEIKLVSARKLGAK